MVVLLLQQNKMQRNKLMTNLQLLTGGQSASCIRTSRPMQREASSMPRGSPQSYHLATVPKLG